MLVAISRQVWGTDDVLEVSTRASPGRSSPPSHTAPARASRIVPPPPPPPERLLSPTRPRPRRGERMSEHEVLEGRDRRDLRPAPRRAQAAPREELRARGRGRHRPDLGRVRAQGGKGARAAPTRRGRRSSSAFIKERFPGQALHHREARRLLRAGDREQGRGGARREPRDREEGRAREQARGPSAGSRRWSSSSWTGSWPRTGSPSPPRGSGTAR